MRYALITGASSGIGLEIARLLARRNYHLIIVARRIDRLETIKKELESKYPIQVITKEADLSKEKNSIQLFQEVKQYPIEVLVNNAGFGKVDRFLNVSLEEELDMIRTNIMAVHILMKLFMRRYGKGYILNVASLAGFQPGPMLSTYGATKAYVQNLSLALSYEAKKFHKNLYITTLCPGPVNTEFSKVAHADFALSSISAKRCAKEGVEGLFQKKTLVVPGKRMKLLRIASKFTPLKIILPIEYKIQTAKKNVK